MGRPILALKSSTLQRFTQAMPIAGMAQHWTSILKRLSITLPETRIKANQSILVPYQPPSAIGSVKSLFVDLTTYGFEGLK
jgi:hypothetical protein